ncbi:abortive infection protein [Gloeomargarita lithophora Alchichica-D10]|uniref:Abortive infection protein n=1 Tax=Gloeomargarita lithophora Alchichica-D10 TaxID=1188229 RepID=A0A1J0A8U2_9CYAN|nr:type II CAAX endopeptidase family protein [Gloeomargarita lithophora]APB32339.1 abortive infection protein [Gloeomargarita lithophora Alchichica-D10]
MLKARLSRLANLPFPLRLLAFVLILLGFWLPVVLVLWPFLGTGDQVRYLATTILYLQFVGILYLWGWGVRGEERPLASYGLNLQGRWWGEALSGWVLGLMALMLLLSMQAAWGWLFWQNPPGMRIFLEGVAVGLGVALAEELLFRGWLWQELRWDYGRVGAVWGGSFLFAGAHFFHPWEVILTIWPQFPGLVLLGLSLAWGRLACGGRLGWPVGFHGGLVATYYWVRVGGWLTVNPDLPAWLTALESNPLASPLGLTAMLGVAVGTRWWAQRMSPE